MEKDPSLISALREYAIPILVFYDSIAVEQNSSFDILLFLISILPLHGSLLVLCITSNSYVSNTQSLVHRDLHTSKQKRSKGRLNVVVSRLPSGQYSESRPSTQPEPQYSFQYQYSARQISLNPLRPSGNYVNHLL
jgi:hypothetical protein